MSGYIYLHICMYTMLIPPKKYKNTSSKGYIHSCVYFWDRERQSMNGGGSERGRQRIWNRLQALSCQHRARHGARTHGPWDHDLRRSWTLNRLSHAGAPVYLFLRQRETEHEWGRVRERETKNLKQAPGSELSAQSPTRGSNSRTVRSWPEPKSAA